MRVLYALVALNGLVWFAVVAGLRLHFTPIGAYRYWWYDDFPWFVLAISLMAPLITISRSVRRSPVMRRLTSGILALTLCAFLPWAYMSGGGV